MSKNPDTKVITPQFRMAFVFLMNPRVKDDGKKSYELTMLFPPDADLSSLKKAANAALVDKWGTDPKKYPPNLRSPFRSGDEPGLSKYDGFAGMTVVRASTTTPPGVVDAKVQPIVDPQEIYPGRWAIASLTAGAYDTKGNRGVTFYLNHVQILRHDTPFAGRSRPEDVFQPVDLPVTGGEDFFG